MPGKKTRNIEGNKYGYLTAIKEVGRTKHGAITWLFKCDCGNERIATAYEVKNGRPYSCGCMNLIASKTHGLSKTTEYHIWSGMVARCYDENNPNYFNYGGRGIKMCKIWRNSFEAFLSDMGNRPSPNHTIDRIDNDMGYCKENCRWATAKEQSRNRRSNNILEINGVKKCIMEWCEFYNISWHTFKTRRRMGVPISNIFLPPRHKNIKYA